LYLGACWQNVQKNQYVTQSGNNVFTKRNENKRHFVTIIDIRNLVNSSKIATPHTKKLQFYRTSIFHKKGQQINTIEIYTD
jgi:hypothetical protein